MIVRVGAAAFVALASTGAHASSATDAVISPADVIKAFGAYCIGTDGKTEKAEAAIMQLRLPPGAATVAPSRDGVNVGIDMGQGLKLAFEMEAGGAVRVCDLRAEVDNGAGLFAILRTTYGLAGAIGDHDAGNKEWTEIKTPEGTRMSGNFVFATTDQKKWSVRLTLLPAE